MILIFFSAYVDENLKLVDDRVVIFKDYMSGWFLIDLISSLPFSVIDSGSGRAEDIKQLKIVKLYKLVKLVKLLRILKILKEQSKIFKYMDEYFQIS